MKQLKRNNKYIGENKLQAERFKFRMIRKEIESPEEYSIYYSQQYMHSVTLITTSGIKPIAQQMYFSYKQRQINRNTY